MSDKNFLGMSTGGKPSVDSRGPQEKGKPSHATAHSSVGSSLSAGQPAHVPNRAGAVKIKRVAIDTPQRGGKPQHHG